MSGPLHSLTVIEFAGLGPAPFCGMVLSRLGARVICIRRPGQAESPAYERPLDAGREIIELDLKQAADVQRALDLVAGADALIEGFRPGVMERLGLGPAPCHARQPALIYGRMTGWGQTGPLAHTAGHDINYIALSGALHAIGDTDGPPVVPLNLVGDFGGGGMVLALGVVAGVLEARASGQGRVLDAAMTDGSAMLMSMVYGFHNEGTWQDARGTNLLDGGAPFYGTYRCADGKWLAVGAIEAPFYRAFLNGIGLAELFELPQRDRRYWATTRARIAARILERTRDEWDSVFAGTDACVTPILSMGEAPMHPHNRARGTFVEQAGHWIPASAPRFLPSLDKETKLERT